MKNGIKTSKSVASKASKILKNKKSSPDMESVAGSGLSNAKNNTKTKKK